MGRILAATLGHDPLRLAVAVVERELADGRDLDGEAGRRELDGRA
jgi:hypothetical protein